MALATPNPELVSLPARPGSYILFLHLLSSTQVAVGGLGQLSFQPGVYAYAGSARGPGGLAARAARHLRHPKPLRWHVDFLRAHARPLAIWWSEGNRSRECEWAAALARLPQARLPVAGFGASDCRCLAHLILLPALPTRAAFGREIGEMVREVRFDR